MPSTLDAGVMANAAVKAASAGLLVAPETGGLGVQPNTGWSVMQPDKDAINGFYLKTTTVTPIPQSVLRQKEAPELVDADAAPQIGMDLTMDHVYAFREGMMLARVKHSGGTGVSRFVPTARTTTAFTVPASGALQQGTLVVPRGFIVGTNQAQNGTLLVVGPASTAISIPVAGGAAETISGYFATLEVAGFRGAAGDIQIDANGDLISTVANFTLMGLNEGQWVYVGGVPGTPFAFALGYSGFAKIKGPITATRLPLARRQWTVGAADGGATKTIDIYFGSWLREVSFIHADYFEPSYHLELSLLGIGTAGATEYVYAQGQTVNTFKITAAPKSLIKLELGFSGTFITDPSTSRATGAATANALLEVGRFNAVTKQPYLRFVDATTEALICNKIASWSLMHGNGVDPLKQQGVYGTAENVMGEAEVSIDAEAFVNQDEMIKACRNNTTCAFGSGFRNADGGIFFDVPALKFTEGDMKFPANSSVMLSPKSAGFRDPIGNYTLGISMFAYLPAS